MITKKEALQAINTLKWYIEQEDHLSELLKIKDASLLKIDFESWVGIAHVKFYISTRLYCILRQVAKDNKDFTIADILEEDLRQHRGFGGVCEKEFIELKKKMAEIKL
jgi:hypothetical protein